MSKTRQPRNGRIHRFRTTSEQMEQYFAEHPRSPSAVRRPRLFQCGTTFVALLGRNLQNGIAGLGNTVEAALRAFDLQYLRGLRSRVERTNKFEVESSGPTVHRPNRRAVSDRGYNTPRGRD